MERQHFVLGPAIRNDTSSISFNVVPFLNDESLRETVARAVGGYVVNHPPEKPTTSFVVIPKAGVTPPNTYRYQAQDALIRAGHTADTLEHVEAIRTVGQTLTREQIDDWFTSRA